MGLVGFEPSDRIPLGYYLSDIHMVRENLFILYNYSEFRRKGTETGIITQDFSQ